MKLINNLITRFLESTILRLVIFLIQIVQLFDSSSQVDHVVGHQRDKSLEEIKAMRNL